ncbi:MAG TPA: TlpA disulfide reductase family protein [Hanamia sp.]
MTKFYLFCFAFLLQGNVKTQSHLYTFTLEGNINVDTGKMILLSFGQLYPLSKDHLETAIVNGKFSFTDSIAYPCAFDLMGYVGTERYISNIFFVDSGTQKITCNIDSLRETPGIDNVSMREFRGPYKEYNVPVDNAFSNYYNKRHSLRQKYNNKLPLSISAYLSDEFDSVLTYRNIVLLSYVKDHPNSYVAFWNLVGWFGSTGYEPIYDSIYDHLSNSIKNTYAGKELAKKLHLASIVSIGKKFPHFSFLNTNNKNEALSIDPHKKYTLIDYWFSHCGPCISEFPELKSLFEKYHDKGFDIKGISVDKKEDVNAWKNVIKQYQLPWKQYLDLNGLEAVKLNIREFPTNFLLNEKGEIIAKNIEPDQLKKLLEDNLEIKFPSHASSSIEKIK